MDECIFTEPLPTNPFSVLADWLDTARQHSGLTNWNTIMLGTVKPNGQPSVRAVLLKDYDPANGQIIFYTNYNSPKALEIEHNPRVALTMHWDGLERQVRVEGRAKRVEDEVSDAYFATRDRESQIGAWASDQSEILTGWEMMLERVIEYGTKFGDGPVTRPPHWGGYRVIPETIEFWHGREGRIHERVRYVPNAKSAGEWDVDWLFP